MIGFSANSTTARLAKSVSKKTGLEIDVHREGKLRHDEVLDLFASAKIYVVFRSQMVLAPRF